MNRRSRRICGYINACSPRMSKKRKICLEEFTDKKSLVEAYESGVVMNSFCRL